MTDQRTRTVGATPLLLALAAVLAAAAVWAVTAFASGGGSSPSSEPASSGDPAPVYVQDSDESDTARGDCPEDADGGSGGDLGSSDPGTSL